MKKFAKWSALAIGLAVIALSTTGCATNKFATDDLKYADVTKGSEYVDFLFANTSDDNTIQTVVPVSVDGHSLPAKYPDDGTTANLAVPVSGPLNLKVHVTYATKREEVDLGSGKGNILSGLGKAIVKAAADAIVGLEDKNGNYDVVIPQVTRPTKLTVRCHLAGVGDLPGLSDFFIGQDVQAQIFKGEQILIVYAEVDKKNDTPPSPGARKAKLQLTGGLKDLWTEYWVFAAVKL
jgi:hypothetical protein